MHGKKNLQGGLYYTMVSHSDSFFSGDWDFLPYFYAHFTYLLTISHVHFSGTCTGR